MDSRTKLVKASFSGGECFQSLTLNLRQQDIYTTTCDFHHQTGPRLHFSIRTHYAKKERGVKMNSRTFFKCVYVCFLGNSVSLDFQNSYMSKPDPPPSQSKPTTFRPPAREDSAQTFYPQKSFPEKTPVNGAEQTQKTITPAYNRFTPKPYTSSARPFERKFESPKFNHNLLPSETVHKPELSSKTPTSPKTLMKAHSTAQPPEFDSGVETFSIHADKPKYQMNNISTMPKAVPVR